MYRESSYNFWARFNDNQYLLLNGVSGLLYEMDEDERKFTINFLSSPTTAELSANPHLARLLIIGKFVMPSTENEIDQIIQRASTECSDTKTLNIEICPTYQCNFRCSYCYVNFSDEKMTLDIEDRIIKYINNEFPKYRNIHLSWFGGEPLLCLNSVVRISKIAKTLADRYGIQMDNTILTNGYLLNYVNAIELFDSGIRFYHITVDGTQEYHDKQRVKREGGATYELIMNNLTTILNNIPDAHVNLRINVHSKSIESVPDLLNEFSESDRDRIKIDLSPIFNNTYNSDNFKDDRKSLYHKINLLNRFAILNGFQCSNSMIPIRRYIYCSADKRNTFQIGPDGTFYKCSPSNKPETKVGYLNEHGQFIELKNNTKWHSAPLLSSKCYDCRFLCFCVGGCRIKRLRGQTEDDCNLKFQDIENMIINRRLNVE
jgi:uncharacterized protein